MLEVEQGHTVFAPCQGLITQPDFCKHLTGFLICVLKRKINNTVDFIWNPLTVPYDLLLTIAPNNEFGPSQKSHNDDNFRINRTFRCKHSESNNQMIQI